MPGGFWGQNRGGGNGNSSSASNRPFRRRRSLLGRKNRSDNDLPQQEGPNHAPQQQLIQQQIQSNAHTTLVLPENVRTILIAGTPECWNLTTTADGFMPENCDASLMTLGSELSPGSLTIDEDEPYHGGPRNSPRENESLEWLRTNRNNSPAHKDTMRKSITKRKHSPTKEPSSMVVVYRSPTTQHPESPQQAVQIWCTCSPQNR